MESGKLPIEEVAVDKGMGLELAIRCQRPDTKRCGYRGEGACFALSMFELFTCEK